MSEFSVGDRVKVLGSDHFGVVTEVGVHYRRVWVLRDGSTEALYWAPERLELVCRAECVAPSPAKHSHYFRPCPYDSIDVYRVLSIFGVTDPCIQHAIKKLLVAGGRGHKDIDKDIQDSIDTLVRWQAMRAEEIV